MVVILLEIFSIKEKWRWFKRTFCWLLTVNDSHMEHVRGWSRRPKVSDTKKRRDELRFKPFSSFYIVNSYTRDPGRKNPKMVSSRKIIDTMEVTHEVGERRNGGLDILPFLLLCLWSTPAHFYSPFSSRKGFHRTCSVDELFTST